MRYEADCLLVDGYSIIHAWSSLRRALARNLEQSRDQLIAALTRLQDASGVLIVVVFDSRSRARSEKSDLPTGIEVVFTRKGLTADAYIERILMQSRTPERFLVATNDGAETFMIRSVGGRVVTAEELHDWLESESDSMRQTVTRLSRSDDGKFRRHRGY